MLPMIKDDRPPATTNIKGTRTSIYHLKVCDFRNIMYAQMPWLWSRLLLGAESLMRRSFMVSIIALPAGK